MEIDSTTLNDLSIFNNEEEFSVFNKLNFCTTAGGKERLYDNYCTPLSTIEAIQGIQETVKKMLALQQYWPNQISNGTVLMIEKFFSATIDEIPENPSISNALAYKLLHGPDFSFVKYSTEHIVDFLCGLQQIVKHFFNQRLSNTFKKHFTRNTNLITKRGIFFFTTISKSS